ncbi:MAG: hypothetical protein R3D27_02380 [Hyphomicrobiaceae bacterium]
MHRPLLLDVLRRPGLRLLPLRRTGPALCLLLRARLLAGVLISACLLLLRRCGPAVRLLLLRALLLLRTHLLLALRLLLGALLLLLYQHLLLTHGLLLAARRLLLLVLQLLLHTLHAQALLHGITQHLALRVRIGAGPFGPCKNHRDQENCKRAHMPADAEHATPRQSTGSE